MKANTTTALALPGTQAIVPKPTKTEIIEAMVARAKVKHDEENARREKLREGVKKKIEAAALKAAKSIKPRVSIYCYAAGGSHCDVKVTNLTNPELEKLFAEYQTTALLCWDEKEVRNAIKAELAGTGKQSPTRLLDNPEAVKAIDAKLAEWGI